MARIVFTIAGNRVQNVGYRLFLLNAMKERSLVGYPTNLADGKQVSVVAWGAKGELNDFYDFMSMEKPSGVSKVQVSPKIIDNKPRPKSIVFMNEKLDLMIEQTGKFVEEGKAINKSLTGMNRSLKKMPKAIGKEMKKVLKPVKST